MLDVQIAHTHTHKTKNRRFNGSLEGISEPKDTLLHLLKKQKPFAPQAVE